jgi:hypothetical protein
MMQRAKNIAGPYTERRQLNYAQRECHEPNQGGLVQVEKGDWYFFTHHGHGDWRRQGGAISVESAYNGNVTSGPVVTAKEIWLQSTWGLEGESRYAYSIDGTSFSPLGDPYRLGWGDYRGDRIGIFTYNNQADAGYVDCDFFVYHYDSPINRAPMPHPVVSGTAPGTQGFGK